MDNTGGVIAPRAWRYSQAIQLVVTIPTVKEKGKQRRGGNDATPLPENQQALLKMTLHLLV